MDRTRCPYNQSHTFAEQKYFWHINRCKDRLKVMHLFARCSYDSLHIVPKQDISTHELICPNRDTIMESRRKLKQIVEQCFQKKQQQQQRIKIMQNSNSGCNMPVKKQQQQWQHKQHHHSPAQQHKQQQCSLMINSTLAHDTTIIGMMNNTTINDSSIMNDSTMIMNSAEYMNCQQCTVIMHRVKELPHKQQHIYEQLRPKIRHVRKLIKMYNKLDAVSSVSV